jgi:hypothetical protein
MAFFAPRVRRRANSMSLSNPLPDGMMKTLASRKSSPNPRQSPAAVLERLREKILSGELREGEQLRHREQHS